MSWGLEDGPTCSTICFSFPVAAPNILGPLLWAWIGDSSYSSVYLGLGSAIASEGAVEDIGVIVLENVPSVFLHL